MAGPPCSRVGKQASKEVFTDYPFANLAIYTQPTLDTWTAHEDGYLIGSSVPSPCHPNALGLWIGEPKSTNNSAVDWDIRRNHKAQACLPITPFGDRRPNGLFCNHYALAPNHLAHQITRSRNNAGGYIGSFGAAAAAYGQGNLRISEDPIFNMTMNVARGSFSHPWPQWTCSPYTTNLILADACAYSSVNRPFNHCSLGNRTDTHKWKNIVQEVVGSSNKQASIFLQNMLVVGTADEKFDIVNAIITRAFPLMTNRFGNFLVQHCFQQGTLEQIIKIMETIIGNTVFLSTHAFGCYVIQKAFELGPENFKIIMIEELCHHIPQTIAHPYASYVWQKIFKLQWTKHPNVMRYINEALSRQHIYGHGASADSHLMN
ncbi:armadillo-type protein [Xylogone sp. PMI_703]|nr:armadillo-type protein [Xylogone sp. PMI_703]